MLIIPTSISPLHILPKEKVIRTQSEVPKAAQPGASTANVRSRKASSSSLKDKEGGQSVEEFFIDLILQRHARKLLSQCRLFDLGTFSAQLDFHMVTWLAKESNRAARVTCPQHNLYKRIFLSFLCFRVIRLTMLCLP